MDAGWFLDIPNYAGTGFTFTMLAQLLKTTYGATYDKCDLPLHIICLQRACMALQGVYLRTASIVHGAGLSDLHLCLRQSSHGKCAAASWPLRPCKLCSAPAR